MKKYILIIGLMITTLLSYSQTVTTGAGVDYYVNDVIVGGGVDISNITINTTSSAVIGEFSNCASTSIGLDRGVILACGDVNLALAANTQPGAGATVDSGSDPDLQQLLGSNYSINDAVVLEFDFVPLSDHVEFKYVFASEEFPEYVGSDFNDVFGFFVNGPGISGPFSNNSKNVALMPNSTDPVTIDNVFPTQYYVDNTGGTTVEYDGLTTVLTVSLDVTACETYHIKIAIGDAGDSVFDSAIFLEANSFSSNALDIDLSYTNTNATGTVIEGCGDVVISFTLEQPVISDSTITYTIEGTATNGTDYNNLSGTIQFGAGEDSTAIVITPTLDGNIEGNETIDLIIQTSVCGTDTITITIEDNQPITADFTATTPVCEGDTVHVEYTGNGTATDTYTWDFAGGTVVSGSGQGDYDVIMPVGSNNITLQVDAENGCSDANSQQTVTVNQLPTATFNSDVICEGSTASLIYVGNASNSATYNWTWPSSCTGATLIGSDTNPDSLTIQFAMGTAADCSPAQITLQVTENGCTSEVATGSVSILPAGTDGCCTIPHPDAGADEDVCGLIYSMNGYTPSPGNNMEWVVINSPASSSVDFSEINNNQSQVTVNMPGAYTFGYHEISGDCDSTDQVIITFYPTINTFAGQDTAFCSTSGGLHASISAGNTGHWLNTTGVTINPNTSPTPSVTANYGVYNLFWVETDPNNVCSDTSSVEVAFIQMPNIIINGADTCGNTVCLSVDTVGNWGPGFYGYWTAPNGAYIAPSDTVTDVCITILPSWGQDDYVTEQFYWHVSNGMCESQDHIDITFERPAELSYPGNNDETCESSYQMQALGQGHWTCPDNRLTILSPNDPNTWISINPNMLEWTDSSQVEFTLIWSASSTGVSGSECTSDSWVTITFFEQPEANAGMDIGVCGQKWRLHATPSINASAGHWSIDSVPAGGSVTFGDGSEAAQDTNATSITVTEYGTYYFVWHEYNINMESCASTDTVIIEFIRIPEISAGNDTSICGWRLQMNAQVDASGTSAYGTWQNAPIYWTDSAFFDTTANTTMPIVEDPDQQHNPNAYITFPVPEHYCVDSVTMIWQEYNIGSFTGTQCVAKDTMKAFFYPDIQADNNTVIIEPEVCGLKLDLTNSQNIYCATGYWISLSGNGVDWDPSDHEANTTVTAGDYGTASFAYVIENGIIPGSNYPVCQDTSDFVTVTFKQKPQVDACPGCYRLENTITSTGEYVDSVRTDTVCLANGGGFYILNPSINIGDGYWSKASSGISFFNPDASGNVSQVENDSVSVIIWNSTGISGNDYYTLVWTGTNSENGCEDKDTLLLSFAKRPSGEIGFRRPYCHGEAAKIWAEPDNDANPTSWSWQFFDNPTIDSTESGTSTNIDSLKQGSHYVRWTTDGDCDNLLHKVSLLTHSDWGCTSPTNGATFIKEPEIVYPKFENRDATCGQNNGIIKIINDSITTCEDTISYAIMNCWQSSTLVADPENNIQGFDEQIDNGANCVIDSIYGLTSSDTSYVAVDYVSLITLDPGYVGEQHHCKDTLQLIVGESGFIDAVIDDERMNTEGTAPLDVTMYHNTVDASKYNWIVRDEEGNIIYESKDEYPTYTFSEGNYEIDLIVKSTEGCYDTTAYRFIMVDSESYIKIPNVFTPNGDGSNDYFQVYAKSLKAFEGFIMNRWGKVLYQWDDWRTEEAGWDGKVGNNYASPGVYFYVIRYKGVYDDEETEVKGALQLVREKE